MLRGAVLVLLVSTAIARAEPTDLVLRADQIAATVTVEIELATHLAGEPISVAPDVWLGATDRLSLGLVHSNASLSRIDRAASYCFGHSPVYGCQRTYSAAGLDARYAMRDDGTVGVAAHARFLIRDVDPWKPALTLGALVRWRRRWFSLTGDPYVRVGLANTGEGNRTAVYLPVVAAVHLGARVELAVHTGYDADLAVWSDGFHIPLGLAASGRVTRSVELGALFGFTSAFGPQDTLTRRTVWFWLTWRS